MATDRDVRVRATVGFLAGVSALAIAGPGLAQTATPQPAPVSDPASPTPPAAEPAADAGDIVVTGSRVQATPGYTSPTPVTSLNAESLANRAPSNIPDALNRLPQFQNSLSNNQSRAFSTADSRTPQGNYLNLRALGVNRTLVLLDGVRLPPTDASGGVDLNTLPQMLVQRVDVVTGGASAAYGSDAVAGVVNLILDKKFVGVKAIAQAGISSRKDDGSQRVGIALGKAFLDDKLHVLFSAEHYEIDGFPNGARPYGLRHCSAVGTGTAANPLTTLCNLTINNQTFGGQITSGPLRNFTFQNDGTVVPIQRGTPTANATNDIGGGGAYQPADVTLDSALKTSQGFARFSYEFSPKLTFHAQGSLARSISNYNSAGISLTGSQVTIFNGNAYLRPEVNAALGTTPSFTLGTLRRDLPSNASQFRNTSVNIITGFDGVFGSNFRWDVNYVYGRTQQDVQSDEIKYPNLYAALDAVRDPSGNIVCRVGLTNPGLYPGCVPINLFGEGNVSPAALAYVRQRSMNQLVNKLTVYSANLRGNLFSTWAGPVAVAVGGEYRRQSLVQTSNADPAIPTNITGLRGAPATTLLFARFNGGVTNGSLDVKEGYAEAVVPLARDLSFAKALDLNGAVRVTDYSTSGTVTTWKAGISYRPIQDILFRGTVSRDIAAPTLFQLFSGARATLSAVNSFDTHTGATGSYIQRTVGNASLVPEIAKTYTVGVVFQPRFLSGFALSVDAYSIDIRNAIATLTDLQVNAICEASNGTAPACALITRPLPFADRTAANFPTQIAVSPLNLSKFKRTGIDFEASYRTSLGSLGDSLTLRGFAAYNPKYERQVSSILPVEQLAGGTIMPLPNETGLPKLSGSIEATYVKGPLTIDVLERFTGSYRLTGIVYAGNINEPNIGYTDLTVRYSVGKHYEMFVNVQNLFDKQPPLIADQNASIGLGYPTTKANYDVIGTYGTVGVRLKF